jgi:rhamnogalacturonyl hydrolase YesR
MTGEEKALVILESMNKYFQIDWAKEDWYVKAISDGLDEIDKKESVKKKLHEMYQEALEEYQNDNKIFPERVTIELEGYSQSGPLKYTVSRWSNLVSLYL